MADNDVVKKPFLAFKAEEKLAEPAVTLTGIVSVKENEELRVPDNLKNAVQKGGVSLVAPRYVSIEKGPIKVSYAAIGKDYFYQIELAKAPDLDPRQTLGNIIQACSAVIPNTIQTYVSEPPPDLQWLCYTIIAEGAADLIGAAEFMEKKLVNKLLDLNFWG